MELYFLIEDIKCDFTPYGNNATWTGKIVDENNQVANDYMSIKTCEIASDPEDYILMDDDEHEIISEDGEIINQEKYVEAVDHFHKVLLEAYWEIGYDYYEMLEIDGKQCKKVRLDEFATLHQLGHVGDFDRKEINSELNTVEDIIDFAQRRHVEIGKWDAKFILVQGFDQDEVCGDTITGWLIMNTGDVYYTCFYCENDIDGHDGINQMCDNEVSLEYLIQNCCFTREDVTGLTDLHLARVPFEMY